MGVDVATFFVLVFVVAFFLVTFFFFFFVLGFAVAASEVRSGAGVGPTVGVERGPGEPFVCSGVPKTVVVGRAVTGKEVADAVKAVVTPLCRLKGVIPAAIIILASSVVHLFS